MFQDRSIPLIHWCIKVIHHDGKQIVSPSFGGYHPTEVIPLEEHFALAEAAVQKQLEVLLEAIRNEHVFQGFAFLRDLKLAISVAPLQGVIIFDEGAIELGIPAENLFDDK